MVFKSLWLTCLIAVVCVLSAVFMLYQRQAKRAASYEELLKKAGDFLSKTPVEEKWESKYGGVEISLDYVTFMMDPNDIEYISTGFAGAKIKFKDDITFYFAAPENSASAVENMLAIRDVSHMSIESLADSEEDRNNTKDLLSKLITYEGKKQAYFLQPVSGEEFVSMSKAEAAHYVAQLSLKVSSALFSKIVVFEASDIKGILLESIDGKNYAVEIYCKNKDIRQVVIVKIRDDVKVGQARQKVKSILASMRYTIEELPDEDALAKMSLEVLKKQKWYVEEDPDKD